MSNTEVRILINAPAYLTDFVSLNESWINEYFELEPIDIQLAKTPSKVIDDGGYIFTLLKGNEVIGVCALFKDISNSFQLARMAVKKSHQGKGYSKLLMEATLAKLHDINASKVTLLTNSKLLPAISLYKKYGFIITSTGNHAIYSRVDLTMEKRLHDPLEMSAI